MPKVIEPPQTQPASPTSWAALEAAIMRKIDGTATRADFELIAMSGIVDDRLRREISRLTRVTKAKQRIQSLKQLTDAEQKLEATRPRVNARLQDLREELAKVTERVNREVSELQTELKAAETEVQELTQARQTLRENVPEHISKENANRRAGILAPLRERSTKAESEWQRMKFVAEVAMNLTGLEAIANLPKDHPGYVPRPAGSSMSEFDDVIRRAYAQLQPQARSRLAELKLAADQAKAEVDAARSRADSVLDYYLQK